MTSLIQRIWTIRDLKAETFMPPFYAANEAVATRRVMATCRDLDHEFSQHAEDFQLFELGSFNVESGMITVLEHPRHIASVASLRDLALKIRVEAKTDGD